MLHRVNLSTVLSRIAIAFICSVQAKNSRLGLRLRTLDLLCPFEYPLFQSLLDCEISGQREISSLNGKQ